MRKSKTALAGADTELTITEIYDGVIFKPFAMSDNASAAILRWMLRRR